MHLILIAMDLLVTQYAVHLNATQIGPNNIYVTACCVHINYKHILHAALYPTKGIGELFQNDISIMISMKEVITCHWK